MATIDLQLTEDISVRRYKLSGLPEGWYVYDVWMPEHELSEDEREALHHALVECVGKWFDKRQLND